VVGEDVGFICLGYRNTLLLQLCEQLGFYHLHDKDAPLMKSDPNAGIALCVDSLWRFNPEDFDDKIIILDELKSVIKHLLHSPTVKNRDKILNLFAEAIRRSRQVICLDGLMADWCVNYLQTIAPDKEKVLNHLATVVSNSLKDVSNRVSCLVQSVQNFEKSNLRECLKEALLESGYKVRGCTLESSEEYKGKLKKETEAVKRRNASDIFNAEKVAPELVDELRFDARWEERCKVIQAKLRERLPGIDQTPAWTEDFIYHVRYEDRDFISHQEMFWLFKHPEVAKRQSQKNLHWMARRLNTFVGNVKSRWAKINALHEMGFEQFLDPEVEWSNDSSEVLELVKQGKRHGNALGIYPGQQSNIRYLGSLLKQFGMKLKCTRKEGKDRRFYQLDQEALTDPTRLQVLACIENRFTQLEEKLDWESAINEAHGILPENDPLTQSGQDSQPTARTPQILYRNEVSPVSKNSDLQSQGDREVLEAAAVQKSELEQLIEALPFAQSPEDFASVIEGSSLQAVEDAIALSGDQPRRRQLREWLEALGESVIAAQSPQSEAEFIKVGQRVCAWIGFFKKWGCGVVSAVLPGVSWDVQLEGECLERVKIYHRAEIELLAMSG
jgi:hypothetical protein